MLMTLLSVFFVLVIIKAAVIAIAYFWQWYYSGPTSQDETHFIRTSDGWRLALHRYRPDDEPQGLPVILCHGVTANRCGFDLPGAPSLAKFLRENGRDVWVAELRGSGMSDAPHLFKSDVPYSWHFEDHLRSDFPAIIENILSRTGARSAHWIGHSMGGMLLYAHLSSNQEDRVASGVTIGSPADFSKIASPRLKRLLRFKWVLRYHRVFPPIVVARFLTPFAPHIAGIMVKAFHAPNISPENARKVLATCAQLIASSRMWLDLAEFIQRSKFGPQNGPGYLEGLPKSRVPLLILAGSADQMAPAASVTAALDAAGGSGQSRCVVLGKDSGCQEEYGHMDMLVGERAETEVFPMIIEWLQSHDS